LLTTLAGENIPLYSSGLVKKDGFEYEGLNGRSHGLANGAVKIPLGNVAGKVPKNS
jgi:hypothetical protein